MTQQHTPGPWTAEEVIVRPPNQRSWEVNCDKGGRVLICNTGNSADGTVPPAEQRGANARLIAAAPDLLAALEADQELDNHNLNHADCPVGCIERSSLWAIAREKRVAAIAKAKGETP